ncbi:transcriptional regulator, TrmB [Sulfolobus islandicus Y.G.57.14]|jgi:sugar-specific transcriptional regulator TrmB|uniref:Transcriptional regulator, TrmB n=3 Tax=Saccharolobus islandicus TaxID=43080 RepID=C3N761_SACI7|nr:TrmB family transcriptional regulator [Sulfolobus islandicus]ACP46055.1 transcriptional regulator, TrmB [Sulfolobus islandicus Y.G.57.14]ACP48234.1 transcriptional regulator, TrmB [Sulfolobus islandicus Y.N.15.51]ADB87595.1 transcriptional regulator TrmB [Sulfolobus islandicus L.D.8.5]PVU78729.1 TrmB family transcriptional regulator [Sulfolobus islandicus]
MSSELLEETISRVSKFASVFGISKSELKVYSYLLIYGRATAREVSNKLSLPYTKVYNILSKLEGRGWVIKIDKRPAVYEAIPLRDVWNKIKITFQEKLDEFEKQFIEPISSIFSSNMAYNIVVIPRDNIMDSALRLLKDYSKTYLVAVSYQEFVRSDIVDILKANSLKAETKIIVDKSVSLPDIPSAQVKRAQSLFGSGIITSDSILLIIKNNDVLTGLFSNHKYLIDIGTVYFNHLWSTLPG